MNKTIGLAFVAMLWICHANADDRHKRIPLAVGSDFQLEPVSLAPDYPAVQYGTAKRSPAGMKKVAAKDEWVSVKTTPLQQDEKPAEKPAENRSWFGFMRETREDCIAAATKLPTDAGVRIAYAECNKRFRESGK